MMEHTTLCSSIESFIIVAIGATQTWKHLFPLFTPVTPRDQHNPKYNIRFQSSKPPQSAGLTHSPICGDFQADGNFHLVQPLRY